ncbi:MAG TPA: sigma-54 dependent transcriptional regulator [Vicinamibacterales bacterium]|nr:sigma-54 dependent transcriptional regulator [Vicinamibacterales bacterium]
MVGISAAIRAVEEEVEHAARCDAKVLITGESGVGKEIVARQIHERGHRRNAQLVTINCAGFPDSLLESELFGHVKGSFTDAYRDKLGWLERANGGTIFMDEIGEMSLRMQALLLRFLETGEIQRVGSDRRLPSVDVRVIAATHRKLIQHIADKTFREDLYYRLNVVHIEVPPLRDRREDVFVLLNHFFKGFSKKHQLPVPELSTEAIEHLTRYEWPGNVRELRNIAERLVLRCSNGRVDVQSLPPELLRKGVRSNGGDGSRSTGVAPTHQVLFDRLINEGVSFWSEVYEPFIARDLTRHEIRELVRLGLEHTRGNYKLLVTTFNMPAEDYKKFLNFLRKYQCHVPFQRFRMVSAGLGARPKYEASA